MKKLLVCLMLMVCLFGVTSLAYGSSGSAGIPHFVTQGSCNWGTTLFLSNITSNPITVKITIYSKDGTILKDNGTNYITGDNVSNYNDNPSDCSVTFTLAAKNSGSIYITGPNAANYGFGLIEWSQDSTVLNGLMAHLRSFGSGGIYNYDISINGGRPF